MPNKNKGKRPPPDTKSELAPGMQETHEIRTGARDAQKEQDVPQPETDRWGDTEIYGRSRKEGVFAPVETEEPDEDEAAGNPQGAQGGLGPMGQEGQGNRQNDELAELEEIEPDLKEETMPRGDKAKYSSKEKRQAEHIEKGYEKRGVPEKQAEARAWATVNKVHGGGEKPGGSGYGRKENHEPMRKGGHRGGKRMGMQGGRGR